MKILKNLFGKSDTKIDANEIAVDGDLLENAVIVDSGSDANGYWIRWGNGLQICFYGAVISGSWATDLTLERTWTFPKPFTSVVYLGYTHAANLPAADSGWISWLKTSSTTSSVWGVKNLGETITGSLSKYIAIGFWK